jgi:PAS domain S-box-containing protein
MDESRGEMTVVVDRIPTHSGNVFTVLDSETTIAHENTSVEQLLGYDRAERVGDRLTEWIHPADRELLVDALQSLPDEHDGEGCDADTSITYRQRRADGSYMVVSSVASTTPGCEEQYLLNTIDVSAQKEQGDDALDQFAKAVSHDLQSPLHVASTRVDLLEEDCESEHIEHIERAHQRIDELLQDLLTLARNRASINDVEWIDFNEACRDCWQTVSTADATISVDLDCAIRADRSRLQQLLENLIRNAVKHGGEEVTIRIGELDGKDGFYVADDGGGIDEGEREQVFESGYSTVPEGTGFGLAIASEVAEAHGWRIDVTESTEGGARFEIRGVEFRNEFE